MPSFCLLKGSVSFFLAAYKHLVVASLPCWWCISPHSSVQAFFCLFADKRRQLHATQSQWRAMNCWLNCALSPRGRFDQMATHLWSESVQWSVGWSDGTAEKLLWELYGNNSTNRYLQKYTNMIWWIQFLSCHLLLVFPLGGAETRWRDVGEGSEGPPASLIISWLLALFIWASTFQKSLPMAERTLSTQTAKC